MRNAAIAIFLLFFFSACPSVSFSQQLSVEMLIVGGGGGGGRNAGSNSSGGGGASAGQVTFSTASLSTSDVLTITIGGGGNGYRNSPLVNQTNGSPSSISGTPGTWTATGGNAGGNGTDGAHSGSGGASVNADLSGAGGRGGIANNGNSPSGWPVSGGDGTSAYSTWGAATTSGELVSGTYYYGGGGAGGNWGGQSGGGNAHAGAGGGGGSNTDAVANIGGGGGGANSNGSSGFALPGGNGGSGIVIIRYPGLPNATGGTIIQSGGYTYHTFTAGGTFIVNTTLPVNWQSFTAKYAAGSVQLNWTVSLENNNLQYEIERAADGINFTAIASLPGNGSTNNASGDNTGTGTGTGSDNAYPRHYTYTDPNPFSGLSYYRIKQTDLDGKFTYSKIVSAEANNKPTIIIGPNPFLDQVQISIPVTLTGNVICRVSTTDGVLLLKRRLASGSSSLNMRSLKSGLYLVSIWKEENCIYVKELMK
ncbi:glycine-rich domain-containing protein [Puia sp.]|jgi:hypothetical protein|uniref:glycine-rich domain-containing protein n=1 Tax=Puia sp. TaxID=2045100 RepID=UPI002F3F8246